MNICERCRQDICGVNILGKQYVQFPFVNICECFLDNCAWICHFETVVGKLHVGELCEHL